jgi:hypothetical protein
LLRHKIILELLTWITWSLLAAAAAAHRAAAALVDIEQA